MSKVAIVSCPNYEPDMVIHALSEALDLCDGLDWVKPGMRIVIKVNLLLRKHPKLAATTHPELAVALTKLLIARGASVIVGDSPGGPFNPSALHFVYSGTEMTKVVSAGATLNYNTDSTERFFANAKLLKKMDITSYLLEADAIISLAKLKTHSMMTYTGAVKNMFGAIPGTKKVECHYRMPSYEAFADMLIDIVENLKPRLFIIDGVIGMEGDGPSAGNPRKIGAIIASKNGHEADLLASSIVGIPAQKIPTLRAAINRGLCPDSASNLDVFGVNPASLTVNDFKFPDHINFEFFNNKKLLNQLVKPLGWMLQTHPEVDLKRCIGCGKCFESCPPHAISMKDAHPSIDREKCIRCFCCQELCPVAAMRIHRSRIIRFLK